MPRGRHSIEPIKVEHKGHEITFDKENDVWTCYDLGRSDAKLSSLKRYLDNLGKSERKVDVEALKIERSYWKDAAEVEIVSITVLCEPDRHGRTEDCWIKKKDGERQKVAIAALAPLDQREKADAWIEADKVARRAKKAEEAAATAISRFTAKTLLETKTGK